MTDKIDIMDIDLKDFDVVDWEPRKGHGYSFFGKTNMKRQWSIASYHPPHSITWGWFLHFKLGSRFWLKKHGHKYPNGHGTTYFSFLRLFTLSYGTQALMPYSRAPMCSRCRFRFDMGDQSWCNRKGCKNPNPEDKRNSRTIWRKQKERQLFLDLTN
jgi:hypothetical protein